MGCGQRDWEWQRAANVENEEWRRGAMESRPDPRQRVIGPHQRRLPVHVQPLLPRYDQGQGQGQGQELRALARPGLQRAHLP